MSYDRGTAETWAHAEPSAIRILGQSEEEAYAFALAVIKKYMECFQKGK